MPSGPRPYLIHSGSKKRMQIFSFKCFCLGISCNSLDMMKNILLAILLFTNFSLLAENAFKSVLPGLPSKTIYYIHQDAKGYIWILTDSGVCRYDGKNLKVFTTKDGLADNENFQVHADIKGNLWFLSYNGGIVYYDNVDNKFHSLETEVEKGAPNLRLTAFFEKNGFIYLANSVSIFKISTKDYRQTEAIEIKKGQTPLYFFEKDDELYFLANKGIFALIDSEVVEKSSFDIDFQSNFFTQELDQENILFAYRHDLYKLSLKDFTLQHILKAKSISEVQKTGNHITVNTSKGIIWLNERLEIEKQTHTDKPVYFCYTDADSNHWMGTGNQGLFLQKRSSFTKTKHPNEEVMVFGKDHKNYVTHSDKIISVAGETQLIINKRAKKLEYSNGGYFVLTNDSSIWQKDGVLKKHKVGNRDFQYHNDSTVISVRGQGIIISRFDNFNKKRVISKLTTKVSAEPTRIYPFKNATYLLGKLDGLSIFNTKSRQEKKIPLNHPIFKQHVISFISRHGDFFYIGTKNNGLFKINAELALSSIVHYPIQNPIKDVQLLNNKIYVLANNLYQIDSDDHVYKVPIDDDEILGINDIIVDNDTLWLATSSGIYSYKEKSKRLYPLIISALLIDNETVNLNQEIHIAPTSKTIQVEFTSPHTNSYPLYYKYALLKKDMIDTLWTRTKGSEIVLNKLPHGEYQLLISATIDKELHDKSNLSALAFVVLPFFYQMWWFYLLCFIAVGIFVYFFFYINILTYNKDLTRKLLLTFLAKKQQQKTIQIKSVLDGSIKNIPTNNILYVKADNKHMIFYLTSEKKIESRITLKVLVEALNKIDKSFIQTHRSFIVNKNKIEGVHATFVSIGNEKIPVGRAHKDLVLKLLEA